MKILHVINSLSGSGGAEQGLVREISHFDPSHEQLVVRLYRPGHLEPTLLKAGVQSLELGMRSSNSGWNWPVAARRLGQVISKFGPSVIHSSLASANLVAQIAARRADLPVLSTFTLSGDPKLMVLYQPGAATLRARALRRVGYSIARQRHVWFRALTDDAADTNCSAAGINRARTTVIPRGVPLISESAEPVSREDLGLPAGVQIILNVGRQTAQKGHIDLVRSFANLLRTRPAHLVVLGRDGDGSAALQQAISQHSLTNHVTVRPYVERPFDYYRSADLFLFPSLMEGLGTAVLEAMACSLPVVAYDIPPVREITHNGRFARLAPVGDVAKLTTLAAQILDDPASAEPQVSEAREHVRDNYSISGVAARLECRLVELAQGTAD